MKKKAPDTTLKNIRVLLFFSVVLTSLTLYSQKNNHLIKSTESTAVYCEVTSLDLLEKAIFPDCFSIKFMGVSHKRKKDGEPIQSRIHLLIEADSFFEFTELSVHGIQGKTKEEDGLTEEERYDSYDCNGYIIQLRDFIISDKLIIKLSVDNTN
ncbi:hypothetical protein ACFSTE_15420 [Aquimarina hainanensis]|uniref:Uncharacterized protein n=1 Tax=Aquimarina hainanensis TaxID=1578017 RepID=A0ABW5NB07_9FLAO|nr:hypothetical protein [Aquimarina sp. TRL1]QKX03454.1 hypothetical protein HN014_00475 [Aquimarina sp. TRL1]